MLKSIQWKLVIISFLLVWLAMSIVGVYITETMRNNQTSDMTQTIVYKGNYLAGLLKDKLSGASNIHDIVNNWFVGQGKQIRAVYIYQNGEFIDYEETLGEKETDKSSMTYFLAEAYAYGAQVFDTKKEYVRISKDKKTGIIIIPIVSSDNEAVGAIYINADLSSINENIINTKKILTNATVWALCITMLLGSLLAKTITGPIKEVTTKAEELAKGDFGQIITVKSNDEVGKLTETFNYLSVRLSSTLDEIRREKNKVEAILTNMTDGIIAVGKDGIILHANPSASMMLGVLRENLDHKSFDEIAEKLELGVTLEGFEKEEENSDNIIAINDRIIKLNAVPLINEKNDIEGALVVLQDVTERERLDSMRKDFVANVSHELRTPLTTIKSYTETLLDGAMDNKEYTENFLRVIDSESDRMTRLVKDLLQLSKLDYDKIQWNMKRISLSEIVKDCAYKMSITAKQKRQQIIYEDTNTDYQIDGDKDRIEQVIINIISNAIKYTGEHGTINISLEQSDEYIQVLITDNGIGIPKKDLPRLFERFYRVDKARSRALGGTGLGLSIARQIVEAHKGFIKIDSEFNKGTTVTLNFPKTAV